MVGATLLAGCTQMATKPSSDPRYRAWIQPVELRLTIPQSGLRTEYSPSWKAWSASLGACALTLVTISWCFTPTAMVNLDSPEVEAAARRLAPLNDATVDLHLDHLAADALTASLRTEGMDVAGATLLKFSDARANETAYLASSAGSLMFLTVVYRLTEDFSRFELLGYAQVSARALEARRLLRSAESEQTDRLEGNLLSEVNSIYTTSFTYLASLPAPGANVDENAARWAADDGRLIRAAMLDGVGQLGRVTARDFGTRWWADDVQLPETDTAYGSRARIVEELPDRGRLLRFPDGGLVFEARLDATSPAGPR